MDIMEYDFTIVTPSFNYGRFIGECLDSVAAQTGVTIEHLVMDAGSTDDTEAVVRAHPHATWFQEPDKGMSDGINKGFLRAKGRWVMWLNADDKLKPGALRAVKEFIDRTPGADVVYGGWDFTDAQGRVTLRMSLFPFHRLMLSHLGCYIGSTACFYRRETTIDEGHLLDVAFKIVMDGEYYNRLAKAGRKFAYLPMVLAEFRRHGENLSMRRYKSDNIKDALALQIQFAESIAIRRVYGLTPFENVNTTAIVDGFLHIYYRLVKYVLRTIHGRNIPVPPVPAGE